MIDGPARIVQHFLVNSGAGNMPLTDGTSVVWPVSCPNEPQTPDNAITVHDTTGIGYGDLMITGESQVYEGLQVRVRCSNYHEGRAKCSEIRTLLEQGYDAEVMIDSETYRVENFQNIGPILPLGQDKGNSKRYLFTVNSTVTIQQL